MSFSTTSLKLLSVTLLSGVLAAQDTVYVDATGGLPTNSGTTASKALKSITQAAAVVNKGGTIIVLPGVYDIAIEGAFPILFNRVGDVTIIAAEGPSKTFIDGGGTYSGIGMVRFREKAPGCRITGFTFRNMADSFWSAGLRLGSTSGNTFRAVDIELDNCVFESSISRAFVVFGADATTKRQSTGMRIHNNLILNTHTNRRAVEIDGDGDNWFYNNVIVHPTNTTNRAAIYMQSLVAAAPAKAIIRNNIVIGTGGTNSWGIEMGTNGGAATVQFNDSFGNLRNYNGFAPHASNVSVDPLFVNQAGGNFRLQATSTLIDAGDASPDLRHDPDSYPQLFGSAPDIGAYESHTNDVVLTSPPKINGTMNLSFTGSAGLAGVFLGFNQLPVPAKLPSDIALIDTFLDVLGRTASPGSLPIPVPNDPSLEGLRFTLQGAYLNPANNSLDLLNVIDTYVRL